MTYCHCLHVIVMSSVSMYHSTMCSPHRLLKLLQEIAAETENKTMIFVETKRKVDEITRALTRYGSVLCLIVNT